ncbi:hypothetical protein CPB83DRAFT_834045 [Crepidotus variabilis]|uniref:EamA domain-containing protein n=1 Tax=Crepidotus variabilis TaxID=179855 RepID=A0A9P6JSE4_9AGAR|nr:hypothetical protein CPB83DRAFT_834045 [Crepidotus variabilis]
MASRNTTYTALTPEYSAFENLPVPRGLEPIDEEQEDVEAEGRVSYSGEEPTTKRNWFRDLRKRIWVDFIEKNAGLLLVAVAQAFFSFMNVAVKMLNRLDPPVSALQLIWVRMMITYVCSVSYMYFAGVPNPFLGPKEVRHLLFLRGFVGFFGLFGVYYSLRYLSLSDATVLTFLAPMFTVFTGAFFLGENVSTRQVFAGLVSLVGVVMIAHPNFLFGSASDTPIAIERVNPISVSAPIVTPAERLMAVGVALIGVLGATGAFTTLRAIGKRAHPMHSLTFFSALCVIVSTIAIVVTKTPIVVPSRMEWLVLLLMIGMFGFIAQIFLTMGLARETAGRGTMAVYTQIVFASILERLVLHIVPSALSVAGTVLILGSALYVAVSKHSSPPTSGKANHATELQEQPLPGQTEMEEGLLAEHDFDHNQQPVIGVK